MTFFLLLCFNCYVVSSICIFLLYNEPPDVLQLVQYKEEARGKCETRVQSTRR